MSQEATAIRQSNFVSYDVNTTEYNVRNIFAENEAGILVPDLLLYFKKALSKAKAISQHLSFQVFWWTSTQNKNKFITFHSADPEICSTLFLYKRVWD